MKNKILEFINAIKGPSTEEAYGEYYNDIDFECEEERIYGTASAIIEEIFSRGNCGRFAYILKLHFPEAKIIELYESEKSFKECLFIHNVVEINGRLYDIFGDVTDVYKDYYKHEITLAKLLENGNQSMDNYSFYSRGPIC